MPSIPYNVPMGEPRPYYMQDVVQAASAMHVSAMPVNPHPAIHNVEKTPKHEEPCTNGTWGHQWHEEAVEERQPIYSLGSFCRFVKIRRACGCGAVKFVAHLYLGDIYITGDWPENLP